MVYFVMKFKMVRNCHYRLLPDTLERSLYAKCVPPCALFIFLLNILGNRGTFPIHFEVRAKHNGDPLLRSCLKCLCEVLLETNNSSWLLLSVRVAQRRARKASPERRTMGDGLRMRKSQFPLILKQHWLPVELNRTLAPLPITFPANSSFILLLSFSIQRPFW